MFSLIGCLITVFGLVGYLLFAGLSCCDSFAFAGCFGFSFGFGLCLLVLVAFDFVCWVLFDYCLWIVYGALD